MKGKLFTLYFILYTEHMLTYILEIFFFISAGIVLYLLMSKLPVVEGMDEQERRRRNSVLHEKIARIADEKFLLGMMKFLRRARLVILKIDNAVVQNLEKMKKKAEEQNQEKKINILKEMSGDKAEESEDREKEA